MMRARALLAAAGLGFGMWGVWLMRDFSTDQVVSLAVWLIGGVVLHDAVLAPLTVGVGVASARVLPGRVHAVASVAFLVWGTLTLAVANVLMGQGGKADNDTLLGRSYVASWLTLTLLLAVATGLVAWRRHVAAPSGQPIVDGR